MKQDDKQETINEQQPCGQEQEREPEELDDVSVTESDQLVAKQEQMIAELEHRVLRLHADFDNYRKRTLREREEQATLAEAELLRKLLPVLDNFDRALEAMPAGQPWAEGVKLVYKHWMDVLSQQGLEAIDCEQPFDPNLHEAVMRDESGAKPDGTILQELQRGYQYKGKLLRPSMVVVANKP
ncbi:MAG: nucleotide exchange factor GrpE [Bacillota bacterium]